jgi:predicted nucleotidyltransferase
MDLRKELESKLTIQSNKYSYAVKKIRELTAARKKATTDADIKKINEEIARFQKTADASMREYNNLVKLRKDAKSYDSLSKTITQKEADIAKATARGEDTKTLNDALIKARNDRANLLPNLGNLATRTQTTVKQGTETLTKPSIQTVANKPGASTLKPPVTTGGTTGGNTGGTTGGTTGGGTIGGANTSAFPQYGGVDTTTLAGIAAASARPVASGAKTPLDTLLAKTEFWYDLPDYIFKIDPKLGELLVQAVNEGWDNAKFLAKAQLTPWWQKNSGAIRTRIIDREKYNDLLKAGEDVSKTDYGLYLSKQTRAVKAKAKEIAGVTLTDEQAQSVVSKIYDGFLDDDPLAINALITPFIGRTTSIVGTGTGTKQTGFGGQALQNYQILQSIAKANGFTLKDILPNISSVTTGGDLETAVLQGLANGDIDINRVAQDARMLAAQGQPKYVRDLLGQGYDLQNIYAPYRQTMASVLEIQPDEIDLNDSTLRMAITDKGDMNLYDFKKALRQDNRWQYTGAAKEEVSNAALKVLQDFGFQG